MLSILLPDTCRLCFHQLDHFSRIPVCPRCLDSVQPLTPEYACLRCNTPFLNSRPLGGNGVCLMCSSGAHRFQAAYSFGAYEGPLREFIHLLKFERVTPLGPVLARLLVSALPREQPVDAVVPVPLHWRRRLSRGFNQAELLARAAAALLHVPCHDPLRRTCPTPPQAGLNRLARRRNVRSAFTAGNARNVEGRSLLLIDDVLTTGATANACAAALLAAGARHVSVATVARADRRIRLEAFLEPMPSPDLSLAKGAS
ncbi:MAG: ComF family protein [Bryobacterales bacterium]|nr:ComF family protein [Bryobacterales bacterium]